MGLPTTNKETALLRTVHGVTDFSASHGTTTGTVFGAGAGLLALHVVGIHLGILDIAAYAVAGGAAGVVGNLAGAAAQKGAQSMQKEDQQRKGLS